MSNPFSPIDSQSLSAVFLDEDKNHDDMPPVEQEENRVPVVDGFPGGANMDLEGLAHLSPCLNALLGGELPGTLPNLPEEAGAANQLSGDKQVLLQELFSELLTQLGEGKTEEHTPGS